MKNLMYLLVGVCLLYSYSETPKEKEVSVFDVEITGFLKDYVSIHLK